MEKETLENYIVYLVDCIKENATEAKRHRTKINNKDSKESYFYDGKKLAYYEILSDIQTQAKLFGIPLNLLHLDDVDVDKDFT